MSRKPEQLAYDALKRACDRHTGLWLQRIENTAGTGMPDILLCPRHCKPVFVEMKTAKQPKRGGKLQGLKIRQSQINWFLKATEYRIMAFVLVRIEMQKGAHEWALFNQSAIEDICSMKWDLVERKIMPVDRIIQNFIWD